MGKQTKKGIMSIPTLADIAEKNRREEEEWAAKCGPVTVRNIEKEK